MQDWKLDVRSWGKLNAVCDTLASLARYAGAATYLESYKRDLDARRSPTAPGTAFLGSKANKEHLEQCPSFSK